MRTTLSAHPAWKITQSARLSVLTAGDADMHAVLPPLSQHRALHLLRLPGWGKIYKRGRVTMLAWVLTGGGELIWRNTFQKKKINEYKNTNATSSSLHVKQFGETMSFKSLQTILYRSHDSGQQPQGAVICHVLPCKVTVCTHHLMFYVWSTYVLIFFFSFFLTSIIYRLKQFKLRPNYLRTTQRVTYSFNKITGEERVNRWLRL